MVVATIGEMQKDPLRYLHQVEQGETVLILQNDRPVAEIRPVDSNGTGPRPFGLCAGQFVVHDDFNQPLPDDILSSFEGS